MSRVYVPRDSAARSVGADEVAAALFAAGHDVVRNGSRGLLFLEPLVEIETPEGRVAMARSARRTSPPSWRKAQATPSNSATSSSTPI
jgi:hypothetical protein